MDWKYHKTTCGKVESPSKPAQTSAAPAETAASSSAISAPVAASEIAEKRECRCMFCGENLVMGSEAEAVEHMRVCPALQEQLQSKDQFHIPSMFRDKMK